jgi:hypothetical protein
MIVRDYIAAHWRGEQSLAKSVLLNGLLGYVLFVAALAAGSQIVTSQVGVYIGMAVFLAWLAWALVGIARCSIKILPAHDSSITMKSFAIASLIGVIVVLFLTIRDLIGLLTPL